MTTTSSSIAQSDTSVEGIKAPDFCETVSQNVPLSTAELALESKLLTEGLDRSLDSLAHTALNIADQLVATRKLNVQIVRALQDILDAESLAECKVIAARTLNGGGA